MFLIKLLAVVTVGSATSPQYKGSPFVEDINALSESLKAFEERMVDITKERMDLLREVRLSNQRIAVLESTLDRIYSLNWIRNGFIPTPSMRTLDEVAASIYEPFAESQERSAELHEMEKILNEAVDASFVKNGGPFTARALTRLLEIENKEAANVVTAVDELADALTTLKDDTVVGVRASLIAKLHAAITEIQGEISKLKEFERVNMEYSSDMTLRDINVRAATTWLAYDIDPVGQGLVMDTRLVGFFVATFHSCFMLPGRDPQSPAQINTSLHAEIARLVSHGPIFSSAISYALYTDYSSVSRALHLRIDTEIKGIADRVRELVILGDKYIARISELKSESR